MNKIPSSWHEKGINTVLKAKESDTARSRDNSGSKTASGNKDEHSYDLDLLVEHAMNNTPKIKRS